MCVCSLKQSASPDNEAVFVMLTGDPIRRCCLCTSMASLTHGDVVLFPENRSLPGEERKNVNLMVRVVSTLCEIALCVPLSIVVSANQELTLEYDGQRRGKEAVLEDVRLKLEGRYAGVIKNLWRVLDDRRLPAAPFDVICHHLDQARRDMQAFHETLCSDRRMRLEKKAWSTQLQKNISRVEKLYLDVYELPRQQSILQSVLPDGAHQDNKNSGLNASLQHLSHF